MPKRKAFDADVLCYKSLIKVDIKFPFVAKFYTTFYDGIC